MLLRHSLGSRPCAFGGSRSAARLFAGLIALPLAFLVLSGPGAQAGAKAWQGREETRGGVLHVMNPAEPAAGEASLRPQELWRLGGESEADEELFGRLDAILVDEKGEIYLLDSQLNEIRVFSAQGDYLRSLGREGEGPGEFRNASAFFFLDGGRLAVTQIMPSRIVVLDRATGAGFADLPLPEAPGSVMSLIHRAEGHGGRIVLSLMSPIMTPDGLVTRRSLTALNGDGGAIGDLKVVETKEGHGDRISISNEQDEDWFRFWSLGADGRVYVAPFYQGYAIHVLGRDGAEDRIIERAYETLPRSRAEMARLERVNEEAPEFSGARVEQEFNPNHRDVDALFPRADGSLWVLTSRGRVEKPAGALGVFDVFDAQGRFQQRLTVFADYAEEYDDFIIQDHWLFVIKEAKTVPGSTASQGSEAGGMMVVIRRTGGAEGEEDEGREAKPLEVVGYELGI